MHFLTLSHDQQIEAIQFMSRSDLADIVKLSLAAKVMGVALDKLYADLECHGEVYRWHNAGEGKTVIKVRTYGKDGDSYGGWSFYRQFESDERRTAQNVWLELCLKAADPNPPAADVEVAEGEMVPAEKPNVSSMGHLDEKPNVPSMAHLESVAAQIDTDYTEYKDLEEQAALRALRIGLCLEFVKEQLPHGQLETWREKHVSISRAHSYRFRDIAKGFLKQKKLSASGLFGVAPKQQIEAATLALPAESEQLIFDFAGGRSVMDICDELGVRWSAPKKKVEATPTEKKPLKEGETPSHRTATECCGALQEMLNKYIIERGTRVAQHLTPDELDALHATLKVAKAELEEMINAG